MLKFPCTNMFDRSSHPKDLAGDIIPRWSVKTEDVVVLVSRLVKLELTKEDENIPSLVDFFVKWTCKEPAFKLLKNVDQESFDGVFHPEPEIARHCTFAWS